jgi:hypothetical protein
MDTPTFSDLQSMAHFSLGPMQVVYVFLNEPVPEASVKVN